jgi:DNA-binding protein H-NS
MSKTFADESLDLENVIKKLKKRDQYINELKDELKKSQDRIKEQNKEIEMFKVL